MAKQVSISKGNSKMGNIPSVSLTPVVTCTNCESCKKDCYAKKMCRIYPTVAKSYNNNLEILRTDRNAYFAQVTAYAMTSAYFRWHVAGDIVDTDYLDRMCKTARIAKNCRFLAFTKNWDVVNDYFDTHKKPRNLQIVFSLPFDGQKVNNYHNFPTAEVIKKGDEPKPHHKVCGGNCTECCCKGIGCWELKKGETIAFYQH